MGQFPGMYIHSKGNTMRDKKTYMILTAFSIFPFNRWYLGQTALARTFTCNFFLFGWIADLMQMGKTFDEAMAKRGYTTTRVINEQGK
jgi:hypothetical protein